jgi:hypothetical protein
MRIACDFCDTKAYGTRQDLQIAGWVRATFDIPGRTTISACPAHHHEWGKRVDELFTAAKVGGTKIPCFENELEELQS